MAVAGESVGGDMTAALTLMAKQRGDVNFVHAVMYYPVTDAAMDTDSYDQFADGPYLTRKAMEWFWDAYTPDLAQRSEITASPNQATIEQLKGLPPTLLLVDEADLLRDEGEAYAAKLRLAGVPVTTVRYDGTCPRLHAAQLPEPDPGRARRHRPGHLVPARRRSGPTEPCAASSVGGGEIVQAVSIVAALATAAQTAALIALHLLRTGYNPVRDAVSDYGIGRYRGWFWAQALAGA